MWKRLKHSSAILVFSFLVFSGVFCSPCYADVTLTDEEALIIQTELKTSQKDLKALKESYQEQKKSYEMQLTEAKKEIKAKEKVIKITSTSSLVLTILCVIAFLI